MGKVTAVKMDVVTKKSGHQMTGMAVSVCLTPAAPSPLPIPYPTMGTVAEGITDPCMRTKIGGAIVMTVGSCMSKCHGNEPGTLKEVVSLNTAGPCFPALGAPIVIMELGMAGITGSFGQMNKSITVGASGSASGAGGGAGGGGGGGGGGSGPGGPGTQGPSGGGGDGGGSSEGAGPPEPPAPPNADGQAAAGHPVDVVTGTMMTGPVADFQLPGPMWVSFVRTYRTSSVRQRSGLGYGWSHSLFFEAQQRGARLTLTDETGRRTTMPFPPSDGIVVMPYGRRLWLDGELLVVDLADGLFRILERTDRPGHYRIAELRDRLGHRAQLSWFGSELSAIVDAVGRRVRLEKEGPYRRYVLTVEDGQGNTHEQRLVTYELDERGDLIRCVDAGGAETRYEYDDEHYLVREIRPDGVRYHFVYQAVRGARRCVETWGDLEGEDILQVLGSPEAALAQRPRGVFHSRFEYRSSSVTHVIDPFGHRHVYEGNALGLVERYVDPRGSAIRYRYGPSGQLLSVTDGAGNAIRLGATMDGTPSRITVGGSAGFGVRHDPKSRSQIVTGPDGLSESFRELGGQPVEHVDEVGRRSRFVYNDHGRLVETEYPNGTKQTRTYDAHGNVKTVTGPTGAEYQFEFDLLGCPVSVTNPDGLTRRFEYDSRNDLRKITESTGRTTTLVVDDSRQIVEVAEAPGPTISFRYVCGAMVERVEEDGSRYRLGYDSCLRLCWIESPAGERYSRAYDAAGNIASERFFSGQTKQYEYDSANLPHTITRSDGSTIELMRDRAGRLVERKLSGGASERYQYDDGGRLVRAENADAVVVWEYDERGQRVGETQTVGGWSFSVRNRLDEHGAVVDKRYSTGWGVQLERRDEDAAPTTMVLGGPSERTVRFDHDPMSREIRRGFDDDSVVLHTERSIYGLPEKVVVEAGGENLRQRRFDWSPLGPLASIDDDRGGKRSYELDERGRVLQCRGLGSTESFRYAPQGTPVPAEGAGWSLAAGGRPTRTDDAHVEWDELGRLVACTRDDPRGSYRCKYDEADRLRHVTRGDGVSYRYVYDALGRRIAEFVSTGESTWFGWDEDVLVEEQSSRGGSVHRAYDDFDLVPLAETDAEGSWRLVACDAAATPWLYAGSGQDVAEIDLTCWGRVARSEGKAGLLRFAGQRFDPTTGLHYNRHRYYDPQLHVFLTPDPLGLLASLQDVGFVPNVTLFIDPLGLTTIVAGSRDDPVVRGSVRRLQREYPGARVIYHDQLGQPPSLWQRVRGRNNRLDGEDHVVVTTHGAPGSLQWGRGSIDGPGLGNSLNNAGFNGATPGAHVDVIACNGATPPQGGSFRDSVAGGVARTTGAQTSGALSGQPDRTYRGERDTINGVRERRDWPRFWRTRQEPTTYQYGPGMMSGTPSRPYVHQGSYVTYGPNVM